MTPLSTHFYTGHNTNTALCEELRWASVLTKDWFSCICNQLSKIFISPLLLFLTLKKKKVHPLKSYACPTFLAFLRNSFFEPFFSACTYPCCPSSLNLLSQRGGPQPAHGTRSWKQPFPFPSPPGHSRRVFCGTSHRKTH